MTPRFARHFSHYAMGGGDYSAVPKLTITDVSGLDVSDAVFTTAAPWAATALRSAGTHVFDMTFFCSA